MKEKTEVKKLKELAEVISGVSIPAEFRLSKGKWQLIRGRNIVENTVLESDVFVPENLALKFVKATVVPGDILLSVVFEQYKVGIVPSIFSPAIADRGIVIIRPKYINKVYLHKFLTSNTGRSALVGQLANMVRGSAIKFVTTRDVAELNIPILPENLLDISQESSPLASKITEMRKMFEVEIIKNVRQFLLEKGWREEQIYLEYPISGGLRADIVLKKEGKPEVLIEVKKDLRNIQSIQNQLTMMSKAVGIKESYLITGDGIKEVKRTGEVVDVVDLPSPKKGKNA